MDLGIKGRTALVCASSKGLGRGCAEALAAEGVDLVLNARGSEALEATAASIQDAHGVAVKTIAADITSEAGQAAVLAEAGDVDILVTNAGGPPPGMWTDWDRDDFCCSRVPGGRWLKCPWFPPRGPESCILKESKEHHSWEPAHASASNSKTVQFFLLIITGMVILNGWDVC